MTQTRKQFAEDGEPLQDPLESPRDQENPIWTLHTLKNPMTRRRQSLELLHQKGAKYGGYLDADETTFCLVKNRELMSKKKKTSSFH